MTDTKTLEDEITRLNSCLQYEQHRSNRISTHGPACATWGPNHYECALRDLSAERAERDKLSAMLDHRNDEATEAERMLRAELSAAHERIKELESKRNAIETPGPSGNHLAEFDESQWWFVELDEALANGTVDQRRAIAVVRNLLATLRAALAQSGGQE